jgi:hypothetical protein
MPRWLGEQVGQLVFRLVLFAQHVLLVSLTLPKALERGLRR